MYGQHGQAETYSRGRQAELKALPILRAWFKSSAHPTLPGSLEDRNGTDLYVNHNGIKTSVDVKAVKMHAPEQILLEHVNNSGNPGWAHRSGFAAIFVSDTDLVLVPKRMLSLLLNDPRKFDWSVPATRKPREYAENFKAYGRPENQDVVAYVPLAQVMKLLGSVRIRWNTQTQTATEVK